MNILHVNKYHHFRGGADVVYLKTAELMEAHGHNSLFFSMHHPDNLSCETSEYFVPYVDFTAEHGFIDQIGIAGRIIYFSKARKYLSRLLDKHSIDIAHLHNIYHQISPSILFELKKRNIPVVMTLHDLKMVCASYLMYVKDSPCEACIGNKYIMAIQKKCVKGSFAKSALAAIEMYVHHKLLDVYSKVDMFIVPSNFHKKKLLEMGFHKEIVCLPNVIDIMKINELEITDDKNSNKLSFVYVGRLSYEKGLFTLIDAAKQIYLKDKRIEIKIIGDGPMNNILRERVKKEMIDNVRFLGYMNSKGVYSEIKKSIAVILPSECYENNPLVISEAFAMSRPVIGARLGGIPELVKDNERGLTFAPGNADDLRRKIEYLADNIDQSEKMGKKARNFVEEEMNAENYYGSLMKVYNNAINSVQKGLIVNK